MEEFRYLDERFAISFNGIVYDKEKDKYHTPKNNYIVIYPNIYLNKSKNIYKVWQKELEQDYKNRGYKLVCDYEPKFSRKHMINSNGEIIDITRGKSVVSKRKGNAMLWENGKESSVHVLVYKAFVGEIVGQVCHRDGDKFNNDVYNLYLNSCNCDQKENNEK